MKNKWGPFTLATLIDNSKGIMTNSLNAAPDEATYSTKFKADVAKEVSCQLHAAIMKSARRFLIDEVIRDVVPDLIVAKKAQRELDRAQKCKMSEVNLASFLLLCFTATIEVLRILHRTFLFNFSEIA